MNVTTDVGREGLLDMKTRGFVRTRQKDLASMIKRSRLLEQQEWPRREVAKVRQEQQCYSPYEGLIGIVTVIQKELSTTGKMQNPIPEGQLQLLLWSTSSCPWSSSGQRTWPTWPNDTLSSHTRPTFLHPMPVEEEPTHCMPHKNVFEEKRLWDWTWFFFFKVQLRLCRQSWRLSLKIETCSFAWRELLKMMLPTLTSASAC